MTMHDSFDPLTIVGAVPFGGLPPDACGWSGTVAIPADSSTQR